MIQDPENTENTDPEMNKMTCNNVKFDTLVDKARNLCSHNDCYDKSFIHSMTKHRYTNRYNHVAYLMKGKKVIAHCRNNYYRQYVQGKATTSLHAEVGCMLKFKDSEKIKKGFSLLILRFNKNDGLLCDSRPCNNCKQFLIKKGITKVYCSTADGTIQKFKLSDIDEYYSVAWLKFKGLKG